MGVLDFIFGIIALILAFIFGMGALGMKCNNNNRKRGGK